MSSNKVALITGGSRGIGLSITKTLLSLGYECIVSARQESLGIVELKANSVHFFACDISKKEERTALKLFLDRFPTIDILVNCAGVAPQLRKDMLDIDEQDFDYVLNINLKGTYFISQMVASRMAKQCFGRIVNISSISSYTSSTMRAEYCISKAGISMLTKLLADRMAEYNVCVLEISPGIIETDMTNVVKDKYSKMIDDGLTPIKRFGQVQDIANCVEAIARGNLDFCTGTVLNCDGGFSVRRL